MALSVNGTTIPANGTVKQNGVTLQQVNINGTNVWTYKLPDKILFQTGKAPGGSWLCGGVLGDGAGAKTVTFVASPAENGSGSNNGNIWIWSGFKHSNLYMDGNESTVGGNSCRLVSNYSISTVGYNYLEFTYFTDNNEVCRGGPPWAGIGASGWNGRNTRTVSFVNVAGNSGTKTARISVSDLQGNYYLRAGWSFSGNTSADPYKAGRRCEITKIRLYS